MMTAPLGLALLLASPLAAARPAQVGEVVDAERAFARTAQSDGANAAFLRHSAPDGIVFQPGPTPVRQALAANPIPPITLQWWPVYAGIAASGDLGFTTGPFVAGEGERKGHGWYFTIWKRQPDGTWRWVLDHGPPTREAAPFAADARVQVLPPGRSWDRSKALGSLRAAEAHLAAALALDARAALPRFLAGDGRLMRVGPQPAVGAAAWAPVLAAGPGRIETAPLGGEASEAGDLAYTYGTARWEKNGVPVEGHYVRIWQRRADGWRLIVDNMIASRPPPPAPSAPIRLRRLGKESLPGLDVRVMFQGCGCLYRPRHHKCPARRNRWLRVFSRDNELHELHLRRRPGRVLPNPAFLRRKGRRSALRPGRITA